VFRLISKLLCVSMDSQAGCEEVSEDHIIIPGRVTLTTESSKNAAVSFVSYEFLCIRRTCDNI